MENDSHDHDAEARDLRLLLGVLDELPIMLDALDRSGNIIYWNKECERVTGYRAEEMLGTADAWSLLYPDKEYRERKMATFASKGKIYRDWEWSLTTKSGKVRRIAWSSISGRVNLPIFDLWCIGIDITDRWRALRASRNQKNLLDHLIDMIPDSIVLKDGHSRWQVANRTTLDFCGLERLPWKGKTNSELIKLNSVCAKQIELLGQSDEAAWLLADRHHSEEVADLRNGDLRMFCVDRYPIYGHAGIRKELIVVARDVTQQRELVSRLIASDSQYRMLATNTQDLVALHDAETRFIYVSPSVEKFIGYTPSELAGRNFFDFIHPDDAELIRHDNLGSLLHGNPQPPVEFRIRNSSGRYFWVESIAKPIRNGNEAIESFVTVTRDIRSRKEAEAAREEYLSKLRLALSMNQLAMFELHLPSRSVTVSTEYAAILGYDQNAFSPSYASWLSSIHKDDQSKAVEALRRCPEYGEFHHLEYRQRIADRTYRWLSSSARIFERDHDNNPVRLVGTCRDITDSKKLNEYKTLASRIINQSRNGITITDAEARIIYTNASFERITGYKFHEVENENPRLLASGIHDHEFYKTMWTSLKSTGRWKGEIWNRRKNGEIYPEWLEITAIFDEDKKISSYTGEFYDLTERKALDEQIRVLTENDPLTGLPNRMLLQDRGIRAFAHAARNGERLAFLLIDIDRFAVINESLGHTNGDLLLREIATRLRKLIRPDDTLGRVAGDEFALLLSGLSLESEVINCAKRLMNISKEKFAIDGLNIPFTLSIGVAITPDAGSDFTSLMSSADAALVQAKSAGRNTWRMANVNFNSEIMNRLRIESALYHAVEQNELCLHYQPVIDLRNGSVIGAEALVRWNTTDRGLVPPGEFIPIAEECGLIEDIGGWVLIEACQQAKIWNDRRNTENNLRIAVNVSARQLQRGTLVSQVRNALEISNLPPNLLELEITESSLVNDTENICSLLGEIKSLGVRIAIDDFGTGYSSFSYLRCFKVDTLKLDQSFVRDMLTNPDDAAIVRAILQMARSLGLRTIAEGVESSEAATALSHLECNFVQGYHFSRPLPPDVFDLRYNSD